MMHQSSDTTEGSVGLKDYLNSIRAHRLLVIMTGAGALALGLWLTGARTPSYEAESKVVLGPTLVGSTNDRPRAPVLEREMEIVSSNEVAAAVALEIDDSDVPELLKNLDVLFVPNSEILSIQATDPDPERASDIANAFAEAYVNATELTAISLLTAEEDILTAQAEEAQDTADLLAKELSRLEATRNAVTDNVDLDADEKRQEYAVIAQERSTVQSQYGQSLTESRNLNSSLRGVERKIVTREASARVLVLAEPATGSTGPSDSLILIAMTAVGLLCGLIAAIVLDNLDATARDEGSIAAALKTRVLGRVPTLSFFSRRGTAAIVMRTDSRSIGSQAAREAFRRLRSATQFVSAVQDDDDALVIAMTSAFPSEGKSVVASNLGIALARSGAEVAIVNADLRRPSLEGLFGVENREPGLSLYLAGDSDLEPVKVDGVDGLWLLNAGPPPDNPAELLGGQRFADLVKEMRAELDYVIIDCPPVLSAADPLAIAETVDGFLVVVDSRTTEVPDLVRTESEITGAGGTLIGAVLNRDKRRVGSVWNRSKYSYYRT